MKINPQVRLIETYARDPIRMWTVPVGDCVAFPTPRFYRGRTVLFSNEGNGLRPRWVALDRYNDDDWAANRFKAEHLVSLYDQVISSEEGFDLQDEPAIHLPPPAPGTSLMGRLVYRLSTWF